MLTRILAAAAFATLSAAAAQAGTIQGDQWMPSSACKDAGDPPTISDKSPDAYNKSGKALQAWQATAQAYATCVQGEAKADQTAVVNGANAAVNKLNAEIKAVGEANDAAIAKLKAKK
ncbi:MAG TPA: hypothetical protein VH722_20110 [Alphaproteobacteria bacterium]|jgi:hypothetical protein|nr:hypothetical protein [Alphaproteobacteria bacterium]